MANMRNKFTGLIQVYLEENPNNNLDDFLRSLSADDLGHLEGLLETTLELKYVKDYFDLMLLKTITEDESLDMISFPFEVKGIGKKRQVKKMDPQKRMDLTSEILTMARNVL